MRRSSTRTPTPRPEVCSGANIAGPNARISSSLTLRDADSDGVSSPRPSVITVHARPPCGIATPTSLSASCPSASSMSS